jgi:hypothetical protein
MKNARFTLKKELSTRQKDMATPQEDLSTRQEDLSTRQKDCGPLHASGKPVRVIRLILVVLIIGSVLPRILFNADGIKWNTLTYYTIQTNLLMGLFWAFAAIRPGFQAGSVFERIRYMLTVAILIAGSLYFLFLHRSYMGILLSSREIGSISAWRYGMDVTDAWINHFVIPSAALSDFLLVRPHGTLTRRDMAWPLAIPFAYFVFHTARGLTTGYYAYNFIDPGAMGGWWNVMGMFFVLTAYVLLLSAGCCLLNSRCLPPRRESKS